MRIADWTPARKRHPEELVNAILARRGGQLLELDKALLWSEPVARGWNIFMRDVRHGLSTDRRLQELGICTVALLTGATYEFHHHAPDFLAAGGEQRQLDALQRFIADGMSGDWTDADLTRVELVVVQFAAQMTRDVRVSDSVFAAMREHFDETQVVELTVAFAAYNMVARILTTLQIEPET
ncbi:MAG: carboxymuconolactone decarboxylase family protein [Variovorax sp.]